MTWSQGSSHKSSQVVCIPKTVQVKSSQVIFDLTWLDLSQKMTWLAHLCVHVKFAKRNISNFWPWLTMSIPNPDSRGCRRERTMSSTFETPFISYALSVTARVYDGVSIILETVSRVRETLQSLERFFRFVSDGFFFQCRVQWLPNYQTAWNRKRNASSVDASGKLKRTYLNSSKITFSAKPCICTCEYTSRKI
jgi:hypothetical protein